MSTWRVDRTKLVLNPISGFFSTTFRTIEFKPFDKIVGSGVARLSSLHLLNQRSQDRSASTTLAGSDSSLGH